MCSKKKIGFIFVYLTANINPDSIILLVEHGRGCSTIPNPCTNDMKTFKCYFPTIIVYCFCFGKYETFCDSENTVNV